MEPLTIDLSLLFELTDENLLRLCEGNPNLRIERTATGELEIMSPTGGRTGNLNSTIVAEIVFWNRNSQWGYVFDSSTGFKLPNGAVRSPDAACVAAERWAALSREERKRFLPLCPDFVVELRSPSDWLKTVERKMEEWMANGCRMAWLIDPEEERTMIYRPEGHAEVGSFDAVLSGEDVLPGFELQLSLLR